jgi:hypothetical protein
VVEQGAARAREADDEERPKNALLGDAWVALAVFDQAQAIGEEHDRIAAGGDAAEKGETGLGLVGAQEPAQRLAKFVTPEVIQPGLTANLLEDRALVERDGLVPQAREPLAGGVHRVNDTVKRHGCERRHLSHRHTLSDHDR